MGFLSDFKSFALKGNVMDLAVGVIIGGAFGKIVTSVVEDIIMPVVSFILPGDLTFAQRFWVMKNPKPEVDLKSLEEAKKVGATVFAYGHFFQTVVDFLIIAFCIFVMVKAIEKVKLKADEAPAPAPPAGPTPTEQLLAEIRDELKKRG